MRITERKDLLQYIIDNRANAGVLSDCAEEEIREWAEGRSDEFIQSVASGIWKDSLDSAGLTVG
jgi:hypothetical protein